MIKRVISIALALMLVVACFAGITVSADEIPTEFDLFIAYGGDKAAENDWGWQYYGADAEGITAVNAKIKEGETATVSLTFAEANVNSWFFAPCLIADGVSAIGNIDFTITCKIDGQDVAIDMAADADGKTWWLEDTGDYKGNCVRLAGGYNEWATKYIAEPAGFTTIEYTVTLNSVTAPSEGGGDVSAELPEEFDLFIAYGGDKAAENDWGWQYYGADAEGITAVNSKIKVGETATISLTFAEANVNSWFFAPCLIADGVSAIGNIDFAITCKIDGQDVAIDMAADADGKTWWLEDTGDYKGNCVRLAGGYNEWATKYIAEPAGFTSIEYTITLNSVSGASEGGDEPAPTEPALEFDPDGTYNAYLMLQTPNWTYRNSWTEATNGLGTEYWGDFLYANETNETHGKVTDVVIAGNGTYTVSVTDFGTIFADDFAAAGQDYFNIIGVSTDLPLSDAIQITDVKLIVDGSTKHTQSSYYQNPDTTDYVQILIQNIWNDDVKEISYYPTPSTSLEIQFTVSGFNYDAEGAADETEPATTAPADSQPDDGKDSGSEGGNNMTGIIIAIVAVVAVAVVVVVVLKKKKAN